jgi:hypothetical protein
MKNSIAIGLLCLLIGIAIGWVAKPGPEAPEVASLDPGSNAPQKITRSTTAPTPDSPGQKSERPQITSRTVVIGGDGDMSEEDRNRIEKYQDQREKMMIERQRKKFDRQITDLVAKLGLDANQEAAVRKLYDERLEGMDGLMGMESMGDPKKMKEISELLRGEGLDEELASLLSEDQLEAYQQMKAEERGRKMDAKALKDLSKLTGVLALNPDQKDAVYEVLYEQAAERIDNPSDASVIMGLSMEGMGFEFDVDDSGIGAAFDMQMSAGDGEEIDQEAMMKNFQERATQRIDDKVNLLSDILDEDQTTRYREHLESRNQGLFGGVMMQTNEITVEAPTPEP